MSDPYAKCHYYGATHGIDVGPCQFLIPGASSACMSLSLAAAHTIYNCSLHSDSLDAFEDVMYDTTTWDMSTREGVDIFNKWCVFNKKNAYSEVDELVDIYPHFTAHPASEDEGGLLNVNAIQKSIQRLSKYHAMLFTQGASTACICNTDYQKIAVFDSHGSIVEGRMFAVLFDAQDTLQIATFVHACLTSGNVVKSKDEAVGRNWMEQGLNSVYSVCYISFK